MKGLDVPCGDGTFELARGVKLDAAGFSVRGGADLEAGGCP